MINRLMLRVALCNALAYLKDEKAQFPTIAGERVFDTKITPNMIDTAQEPIPLICVYALDTVMSDDKRGNRARFNGVNYIQTFAIELTVAIVEENRALDTEIMGTTAETLRQGPQVIIMENDAELAAVLDLFEAQVWRTIHDQSNPWSRMFAAMTRNAYSYKSEFEADGEKNNKRALRRIMLEVEMCTDPIPKVGIIGVDAAMPDKPVDGELDSLMDSYIGPVIKNLLEQPDTRSILAALRSTLGSGDSILAPGLKRIGITARGAPTEEEPGGVVLARQNMELNPDEQ